MTCKDCHHHLHNYHDKYVCTNKNSDCYGLNTDDDDSCALCETEWIRVEDGLPRFGEVVVTYRPETNGKKVNTERYLYGEWTGWTPYRGTVTHWLPLPELPEE